MLHTVVEEEEKNAATVTIRITYVVVKNTLRHCSIKEDSFAIDEIKAQFDSSLTTKKALVNLPRELFDQKQAQLEKDGHVYLGYADVNGRGDTHHPVLLTEHPSLRGCDHVLSDDDCKYGHVNGKHVELTAEFDTHYSNDKYLLVVHMQPIGSVRVE